MLTCLSLEEADSFLLVGSGSGYLSTMAGLILPVRICATQCNRLIG